MQAGMVRRSAGRTRYRLLVRYTSVIVSRTASAPWQRVALCASIG